MNFTKKMSICMLSAIALVSGGNALFAGSIDYLSNQSADYMRMFSRNGATDGADIAIYNPAATAYLKPGLYFQLSHQTVFKTYEDDYRATDGMSAPYSVMFSSAKYKTTKPTPVLPSAFAIYNGGKWAGYIAASATAGGGSVRYNSGVPLMQFSAPVYTTGTYAGSVAKFTGGKLEANSFYPQLTMGGSYALNDMISFSLGVRGVYGYKTYNGHANYSFFTGPLSGVSTTVKLDAKETAFGVGAIVGAEVRPAKDLIFAVRYETQTKLDWKTEVKNNESFNGLFQDNKTRRKDLPAMIGLGTSYVFFDRLNVIASFDGFFIKQADQHKDVASKGLYQDGYDDDYAAFGWEASLGAEYALIPNFLKVSAGYMYNDLGGNKDTYNDLDFSLDSHSVGAGVKVSPTQALDITFSTAYIKYVDGTVDVTTSTGTKIGETTYKKKAYVLAASAEYKIQ